MSDINNQEITITDLEMVRENQQKSNQLQLPLLRTIETLEGLESLKSLFEMLRKNQQELGQLQPPLIESCSPKIKDIKNLHPPQQPKDIIESLPVIN